MAQKVFIIHGHDSNAVFELKEFLSAKLRLVPMVLRDLPNAGMTIIEKFERYAPECQYAIAVLTPDDKQAQDLQPNEKWRARQNVIFEMGWFMAARGRKNVMLLHKGAVELPSDVLGILYLGFAQSIYEVSEKIREELSGRGLI